MNLKPLFMAVDQKPFVPFEIGLNSGERIPVSHPDNIFFIPNRQIVDHVEVYRPGSHAVLIWPIALASVHFNGDSERLDG